ncbi:uncharacterized protein LY89DRAFT_732557 [Mollisia scopiformis]|uniref:Uncharacterized protein n=1 Tax=Mollisia scopiformis TaxID=149040 RepID=A0A194XCE8_MOLSC|nr:uncharacterized protein LY89DRAFT_732557 [Mollisia scopiformis]KUJ17845.1 hypothetical protein LY89DRAFT_732557 [Mollisia scopiformis]
MSHVEFRFAWEGVLNEVEQLHQYENPERIQYFAEKRMWEKLFGLSRLFPLDDPASPPLRLAPGYAGDKEEREAALAEAEGYLRDINASIDRNRRSLSFCWRPAHLTRDCKSMQRHVSKAHQQKLALYEKSPLWRGCKLQTFFAENRWVRYFVVEEGEAAARGSSECSFIAGLDSREADFFTQLDEDAAIVGEDAKAEANTVYGFGSHKSAVVPWLRRTGIEEHTRGLKKDEMHTSFAVPKNAESEPELFLMLEVMDEIFTEAHS